MKLVVKQRQRYSGLCVVLAPSGLLAEELSIRNGLAPSQLHLTLAYMGDMDDYPPEAIERLLASLKRYAPSARPVRAILGGVGRFTLPERDSFYISVDSPDLLDLRRDIESIAKACGLSVSRDHGFLPHITLAYLSPSEPMPLQRFRMRNVKFKRLELWQGPEHHRFYLGSR